MKKKSKSDWQKVRFEVILIWRLADGEKQKTAALAQDAANRAHSRPGFSVSRAKVKGASMIEQFISELVSALSKETLALPHGAQPAELVGCMSQWCAGRVCVILRIASVARTAGPRFMLDVRFGFVAECMVEAEVRNDHLTDFLLDKATTGALDFGWYRVIGAVLRSQFAGAGKPALVGGVWRFELLHLGAAPIRPGYWLDAPK